MPLTYPAPCALKDDFEENVRVIERAMHIPLSEDAVRRDLTIAGRRAALYFVDGMVDNERIAHYVIAPCMLLPAESVTAEYLMQSLLPVGTVAHTQQLTQLITRVYAGDAAIICEGVDGAVICDIKGDVKRSGTKPQNENVVEGPQEGFTETLRDNIVLLRRIMRTPQLISRAVQVGERIETRACVMYLDGVAEEKTVDEVLRDVFERVQVPVITGLQAGHMREKLTLALGRRYSMDADAGTIRLLA